MYCVIQEIETKKEIEGYSKGIEAYSYTINNVKINSYRMKAEKFKRPIKKAYKISIHKSYREDGKVKKKQWVIGTHEHYNLIEYGFELWRVEDKLKEMGITEDRLYELIYKKLDPLLDKITNEFHNTEEYKTHKSYREIINKFHDKELEFNNIYGSGYNECYDIFGNLTNKDRLEQIKRDYEYKQEYKRKSEEAFGDWYSRYSQSNYSSSSYQGNTYSNYNEEEKKLLKKIYKKLAMIYHPDRNLDNQEEAQESMILINKLKEQWNI